MRFHNTSYGVDDSYIGTATNDRRDPARTFCDAYRATSSDILDASSLRLEPTFWGSQQSADPAMEHLRYGYSEEEEPGIFEAVFACLGYAPSSSDIVIMMPDVMLLNPTGRDSLVPMVVQDAASVLTDEFPLQSQLGWASPDVVRAAIAAVITHAAEPLFPTERAVDLAYERICATAINGMIRHRYDGLNGPALLVRRNPGLVSLLSNVVKAARQAPPLSLKLDINLVLDASERNLAGCAAGLGRHLSISA